MLNTNKLTRYERARIIGARALQISMGAPVLLEDDSGEPIDIAFRELEMGVIPVTIKRLADVKIAQ
ncbi:MAG: DNA-directed RNA polymerase subunit K [Candidatus Methanocomedens sp.]|nr:MAG: DNA-directed RNA polymerase subunit K [ANME-2 cluster archaeon]